MQLKTNKCHIGNKDECGESKNQEWIYHKDNKTITSKLFPDKCFDVYNFQGPTVQVFTCHGSDNQQWEYDEKEHTLKSMGKCLTIYMNEEAKEIWAGRLYDNSFAVLFLNKGTLSNELEIKWTEIGFYNYDAKVRDLWERRDLGIFKNGYKINLNSHTSKLFKITPIIPKNDNKEEYNIKVYVITIVCLVIIIVLLLIVILFLIQKLRQKSNNNLENDVNKMNTKLMNDK